MGLESGRTPSFLGRGVWPSRQSGAVVPVRSSVLPVFCKVSLRIGRGLRQILETFQRRQIKDRRFDDISNCNRSSLNQSALSGIFTRVIRTRTTLIQSRFISNARTVTYTLFNILQPKSRYLTITKAPCSALRRIVKLQSSNRNSLTRFNVACQRLPLATTTAVS